MNEVKGFSTPPVKVSEMRQLLETGRFANWIADIKKESEIRSLLRARKIERRNTLRLASIIVDHARKPREYHTWFIVFLLVVIVCCLAVIVGM